MATNIFQTTTATPDWQPDFLRHVLPAVQACARRRFRSLPPFEREEAEAEAVAVALVFFVRLVQRGKDPIPFAGRLAMIAVLRVKCGRIVGSRERCRDVLSRLARQRQRFTVTSLDVEDTAEGWQAIVVEDRGSTPADIAACKIDFSAWLDGMTGRRRQIAEALAEGNRTEEVAAQFQLSHGRISQIRREFYESWNRMQGDATPA